MDALNAELERAEEPLDPVEEHRLRKEIRELRAQLDATLDKIVLDRRYQEFIAEVASAPQRPPEWIARKSTKENHEVIPTVCFSDAHLDEQVFPDQIQGLNGYNREIAEKRLKNYFNNIPAICHEFLSGFRYPGIVMAWLGDNFSGNIHEELRQTNCDVLLSSLLYWVGPVAAGIKHLAGAFGQVYIPVVVGNHGRNSLKPVNKMRVRDNFDWLFAHIVRRELAGDDRIVFNISESADFTFAEYSTTYHITHGDQAKGGTGIAAQWSPLMLMAVRKRKRVPFDYLVCGHWHQLGQFQRIRANGTIKGYDEFAFHSSFDYRPPEQDLWLTDPRRGIIGDFPVHVASKDEPWFTKPKAAGGPYRPIPF